MTLKDFTVKVVKAVYGQEEGTYRLISNSPVCIVARQDTDPKWYFQMLDRQKGVFDICCSGGEAKAKEVATSVRKAFPEAKVRRTEVGFTQGQVHQIRVRFNS